jgi:hypothetical protein
LNVKNFSRYATWALAAAGIIASALPSHAYRMIQNTKVGRVSAGAAVSCSASGGFAHWSTSNIDWYLNTSGQGSGKSPALSAAMSSWTHVPNTHYTLNYAGKTAAGFAIDGRNTLVWDKDNGCTGYCIAITALVLQEDQVIVETDISFNAKIKWQTGGGRYDTQSVAAHELGHSLGIHHTEVTSTPKPTMNATYFGIAARSLEADDQEALQCSESQY